MPDFPPGEPYSGQLDDFEKKLTGLVGDSVSAKAMTTFAKFARDMIVKRTRRGFGVEQTGRKQQRLKKLSKSYIDFRKGKVSFFTRNGTVIPIKPKAPPKLDSTTSPGKSNLTFSGQLLRSLVVSSKKGEFTIRANNRRRKNGLTNNELAEIVSNQGRPFMGLTVGELRKLRRLYENGLAGAIKRQL